MGPIAPPWRGPGSTAGSGPLPGVPRSEGWALPGGRCGGFPRCHRAGRPPPPRAGLGAGGVAVPERPPVLGFIPVPTVRGPARRLRPRCNIRHSRQGRGGGELWTRGPRAPRRPPARWEREAPCGARRGPGFPDGTARPPHLPLGCASALFSAFPPISAPDPLQSCGSPRSWGFPWAFTWSFGSLSLSWLGGNLPEALARSRGDSWAAALATPRKDGRVSLSSYQGCPSQRQTRWHGVGAAQIGARWRDPALSWKSGSINALLLSEKPFTGILFQRASPAAAPALHSCGSLESGQDRLFVPGTCGERWLSAGAEPGFLLGGREASPGWP